MERAINEFTSALAKVRVGIVPQNEGGILFVGNESELERASFILSEMGYIVNFNGSSNFIEISDFNKYENVVVAKLPTSELNEDKLIEVLNLKEFPKHCLIRQTEGVYAVIGNSLDAVSDRLHRLGFMVFAEKGNFITVSLLRVKHGSKAKNCA